MREVFARGGRVGQGEKEREQDEKARPVKTLFAW